LHRLQQAGAIEFAIAEQHHPGFRRDQPFDLLDQGDMQVFGKVQSMTDYIW
jgi:hypothetical protein